MRVVAAILTHQTTAEQLLADNYVNSLIAVAMATDPIHVDPTRIQLDLEEINELNEDYRLCLFSYETPFTAESEEITAGVAYVGPELANVDPNAPNCEEEEWYQNASSGMCTVGGMLGLPEVTQVGVMEFFHTTRPQETLRYLIGISGAENAEPHV